MKRMSFIVLLLMIVSLHALNVQNVNSPFRITNQTSDHMDIEFTLPAYKIVTETSSNQSFQRIQIENADYLSKEGMPELPVFSGMLAIPYHGSAKLQLISSHKNTLTGINPYPVQSKVDDQSNVPEFQINRSYYENGGKYPEQITTSDDPAILRDFRVMNFSVHPFEYNAATKQMLANDKIVIRVTFNNTPGMNEMDAPTAYSTSFESMYKALLLNYDDVRDVSLSYKPERILIIYANSNDNIFLNKLTEFVNWKQQKGYVVQLASTLQTGSQNTTIKTYIQNTYNNAETRPDYIILIGDANGTFTIPAWDFSWGSRYTGEGDYPYTHLAGNDLLGDVFIGRMSISTTTDFLNLVAKGFAYERDMNIATSAAFLNRMLLVGDTGNSGISTIYTNKYIKDITFAYNHDYTYSEVYGGSFATSMNSALNMGVGFMNYRGWLGMSSWSPGTSLVNGGKTPHAVIITCGTGSYAGSYASTTEAFTLFGTVSSPGGALTAIGMATSGTHTMLNNCLSGSIYEGLFTYNMHTMSQAMLYGKIYLDKIYRAETVELTHAFTHICNLMGDPTVEVFKGIPGLLQINTLSSIAVGTNLLDITVNGNAPVPVENAHVTVTQGASVLFRGVSDASGHVSATLPADWTGNLTVTASKQDFLPKIITVNATTSGSFIFRNIVIDDDNNGNSIGNGDSVPEGNETVELNVNVKNTFSSNQDNMFGILSCSDPYISIIQDSTFYGMIISDTVGTGATPFVVHIANNCPNFYQARMKAVIQNNAGDTYDVFFLMTIRNADLDFVSIQVEDESNQILDPGENALLNITLNNNGLIAADNIYASLRSLSSLVEVTDTLAYFGTVAVNTTVNCSSNPFGITGKLQLVPGMMIPFELTLYNENGYQEIESFQLTVGTVASHDPLGPDTYGYYIYDVTDVGYPDVPTYQWIGISPEEGGSGTLLTLNDTGASGDEGDTTTAVSLASVTLPFAFSFYGQQYTQISVCSNGFIAFGSTQNGDFRNWHIPGALGPNPMIAAFWDDLCLISGGGVYTYYNAVEHCFVIEWYHTMNGYNRTSEETFQAILYNQDFNPTSLGDGQIKLQYKTFNNVDAGSFGGYSPTHGNYCTIGIKDHTGTRGLEYTFNNQYPTAASSLGNNKALFITGTPIIHQEPHLLLSEIVLHNTNSSQILEPNEIADLSLRINNLGETTATNVSATISSADPYVEILTATANYDPIEGEHTALNKTYYRIRVLPSCPDGHVIIFNVDINALGFNWQRQTSISVVKPKLTIISNFINDHAGNGNGVADPGEHIKIAVNVQNPGSVIAHDAIVHLTTTSDVIIQSETTYTYGDIPVNGTLQKNFSLQISSDATVNDYVAFDYSITAQNMDTVTGQISLAIGLSGLSNNFELNNGDFAAGGWTCGTSTITLGHSGARMWGTSLNANYPNNAHYELVSTPVTVGANASLDFWQRYGFESGYDGGNVWISINNGQNYTLITPIGGYPNQSISILGNRPGYTGTLSTWTQAHFNLSQFAGQSIRIKWNFQSDNMQQNTGWFVDDVEISGFMQSAGIFDGNVILPSDVHNPDLALISAGNYLTHPNAVGHFELLLPNGTYQVSAKMASCQDSSPESITFAEDSVEHTIDFTFNYLRPITYIFYSVNSQIAYFSWVRPPFSSNHLLRYDVYQQIETDIFRKITETVDTSFTDSLHVAGDYAYYVKVVYAEGESNPSDTLSFNALITDNDDYSIIPLTTKLNRNYPNPFNPDTNISFDLAENGPVNLTIYNIKGQRVRTLVNERLSPGNYNFKWNGKNEYNKPVASGVYFFRLKSPRFTGVTKAILLK